MPACGRVYGGERFDSVDNFRQYSYAVRILQKPANHIPIDLQGACTALASHAAYIRCQGSLWEVRQTIEALPASGNGKCNPPMRITPA